MRITVLIENTAPDGPLFHEHGLSLHLSYEGHSILLDAGATGRSVQNAQALGIDVSAVEAAVLSHGHDDHADGFSAFFACNPSALVYARPAITQPYYLPDQQGGQKFIGVNPALLARYQDRFSLADGPRAILPGLHLIPDPVVHEQSLVAETGQGLVIFNSCCHAGADAVVESVLNYLPGRPVRALIGGFHLVGSTGICSLGPSPQAVTALAARLAEELGVAEIYTGHCTGQPALALLEQALPGRVHRLTSGLTISL